MNAWMVRAETGGRLYDLFKDHGLIAIGWSEIGALGHLQTREEIIGLVQKQWPEWKVKKIRMAAGQLYRFRHEIQIGDFIVTYNPSLRVYLVGTVSGDYRFDPSVDEDNHNVRPVSWNKEVPRDNLSVASKNTLGAVATLFALPDRVRLDLLDEGLDTTSESIDDNEEKELDETELYKDVQARALEFIKDQVSRIDWDEMQELVAGLLRAMGYKTRVSPKGADRGKDIVASPDGFGFEAPRIVVEVKHRKESIDASQLRSFLGGRHKDDKGLYVSTGGFTKDARYEADRANIPLTLMDMNELVEALIENYEDLDVETKQLLPLKRLYWPT